MVMCLSNCTDVTKQNSEPYIKNNGELEAEAVHASKKMVDDGIENLDDYSNQ